MAALLDHVKNELVLHGQTHITEAFPDLNADHPVYKQVFVFKAIQTT